MQGKVPEFITGDMQLAFTINKKTVKAPFPTKELGFKAQSVDCGSEVEAKWDDENWALQIQETKNEEKIKCVIDFEAPTLSDYIIGKSSKDESIEKQTHDVTDQTGSDATTDYRYVGATPNNYVCLKSEGACSEEELYRIIGVIPTQKDADGAYENRVKLISNTSYTTGYWSGSADNQSNDWKQSTLNTVTLNQTYWEEIRDYHQYIDLAKWYLGKTNDGSVLTVYNYERSNGQNSFIITNIGLIYLSDYGFGTGGGLDTNRETCLSLTLNQGWFRENNHIDCANNDWLSTGKTNWALNPSSTDTSRAWLFVSNAWTNTVYATSVDIRPSFYLKGEVKYGSGTGEKTNPYKVTVES